MGRKSLHGTREKRNPYDYSLDLHGMHSDEAMALMEQIISSHMYSSILIIHGNGTGALPSRVRGALKSHRFLQVRDYFFGEDIGAPGFDGTTVIYT